MYAYKEKNYKEKKKVKKDYREKIAMANDSKVSAFGSVVYDNSVANNNTNTSLDEYLTAVLGPR